MQSKYLEYFREFLKIAPVPADMRYDGDLLILKVNI